jgi:hypothetical protein
MGTKEYSQKQEKASVEEDRPRATQALLSKRFQLVIELQGWN